MPRRLLPKERLRDKHVDVYLSQDELAAVQAKAQEAGLRLAEFVRASALAKQVHAVAAANPLIWASLAPTCANLNQLAKHANEGRVTNIPADLLVELHEKVQALRMALLGRAHDPQNNQGPSAKNGSPLPSQRFGQCRAEPGRGKLLATNFAGADAKAWSREFAAFRKLKPNLSRAVAHISLSLHPEDRSVGDEEFIAIATRFKAGLGYTDDCPYLLVRHFDKAHQHVHLLLSRISANGGVVPETNDYRMAEKLAAALRKEYGLIGPATHKKNDNKKESAMNHPNPPFDDRKQFIEDRLEAAMGEIEANRAANAEPEAMSIGPAGAVNINESRDWRREILTQEYQRAMNDIFLEQLRYVRKSSKTLTLYFRDGSHLKDSGDLITAFNMSDPAVAAARIFQVACLKNWENGIIVRGSDAFVREAAILVIQKNMRIVAVGAHQLAIIAAVRESMGLDASDSIAWGPPEPASAKPLVALTPPVPPPPLPANPLKELTGTRRFGERLNKRRRDLEQNSGSGTPPGKPVTPRRRGL